MKFSSFLMQHSSCLLTPPGRRPRTAAPWCTACGGDTWRMSNGSSSAAAEPGWERRGGGWAGWECAAWQAGSPPVQVLAHEADAHLHVCIEIIILNTKSIMFTTTFIISDTKSIIFTTTFIISDTKFIDFNGNGYRRRWCRAPETATVIIFTTKSLVLYTQFNVFEAKEWSTILTYSDLCKIHHLLLTCAAGLATHAFAFPRMLFYYKNIIFLV